jgi:hypothetical protein
LESTTTKSVGGSTEMADWESGQKDKTNTPSDPYYSSLI